MKSVRRLGFCGQVQKRRGRGGDAVDDQVVIAGVFIPASACFHAVQTISSHCFQCAGHSCRLHRCSSSMPLVVEPSTHPCEAWLLIAQS